MENSKRQRVKEVSKFGGTEKLGEAKLHGHQHEVDTIETESKTKLEDDRGEGGVAIIRQFTFGINPQVFQERRPTKQDLFNHHIKGIETMLWRDGMKVMTDVEPQILIKQEAMQYEIFVGAEPMKGHILRERPQTLSQIAHG